jgi:hypothetical protein
MEIMEKKKLSKPEPLRLTKKEQSEKNRWVLWSELMKRVLTEDVGCCVNCGGKDGASGCGDSSTSYDCGVGWVDSFDI